MAAELYIACRRDGMGAYGMMCIDYARLRSAKTSFACPYCRVGFRLSSESGVVHNIIVSQSFRLLLNCSTLPFTCSIACSIAQHTIFSYARSDNVTRALLLLTADALSLCMAMDNELKNDAL